MQNRIDQVKSAAKKVAEATGISQGTAERYIAIAVSVALGEFASYLLTIELEHFRNKANFAEEQLTALEAEVDIIVKQEKG
jgi:hypothetical protein